jgi:cation transport regulator
MPYTSNTELPEPVRKNLPREAQEIYREAFNAAFERYGATHEAVAHRIAWSAVKRCYIQPVAGVWLRRREIA